MCVAALAECVATSQHKQRDGLTHTHTLTLTHTHTHTHTHTGSKGSHEATKAAGDVTEIREHEFADKNRAAVSLFATQCPQ